MIANTFQVGASVDVRTDVKGPWEPLSFGGRKYYVTLTDDHTPYTRPEILRTEDQVLGAYKVFAAWVSGSKLSAVCVLNA